MKKGLWFVSFLILSVFAVASADLRSSNATLSSIDTDQAQIRLLLNSLQQAIQQEDIVGIVSSLRQFVNDSEVMNAPEQSTFDSLFAAGADISPTVPSDHRDWWSTAYSGFNFEIDSIIIYDSTATALVHVNWLRRLKSNPERGSYSFPLVKNNSSWHAADLSQVLSAMRNYLTENTEVLKLQSQNYAGSTKSAWDDYNEWLSNSALHLLLERDLYPPDFPRLTEPVAEEEFDTKLFQCAGIPSSYYYENDPLVGRTVSIAAISDHCWQRFVVADLANEDDSYIFAKGRYGTGANVDEFAGPGGLEFIFHDELYVCDRGNDRIKVINIDEQDHQPHLQWIKTGVNEPFDVDAMIDHLPAGPNVRRVIVAEHGANAIYCYCESMGCVERRMTNMGTLGFIDRPTSVTFARNATNGEKIATAAYFIDKDGTRLVKINYPFSTTPTFGPVFVSPDPITLMTDVSVDNHGQVWVVESEKGKIYKFNAGLQLLAIHGGEGDGPGQYSYPYGLSFTQAYHFVASDQPLLPISNMAEAILTERWGSTTGVRRVLSGVDVQSFTAEYRPRLAGGAGDAFLGQVFVTDLCDWTLEFFCNSVRQDIVSQAGQPAGLFTYLRYLPVGAPSGLYEVRLTVESINANGNTVVESRYAQVDRTITNQPPNEPNIWFPDGDSCFIMDEPKVIRAYSADPDGHVVSYNWAVTIPGSGEFYWTSGGEAMFVSHLHTGKIPDPSSYIQVTAVDNYGQTSPYHSMNFSRITVFWPYDCICTWQPGDPDFSHYITISDIVYITNYIFAGGPAPIPIMEAGDSDCNGIITISDALYLINYIFVPGSPAVQCDCSDY